MGAFCLSRAPYTSRLHGPIQLVSDRLFARETAVTHRIKSVRNSNIFGELLSTFSELSPLFSSFLSIRFC